MAKKSKIVYSRREISHAWRMYSERTLSLFGVVLVKCLAILFF